MSQNRDFEELLAPAEVAKELDISVATLRKYSLLVEKVTSNSNYYQRNKQRARLYSKKDIADLKNFKSLAKNKDLTLLEAARQVFAITNKAEEDAKKKAKVEADKQAQLDNAVVDANQVVKLLNMLQQTIASQNQAIQDLQAQVARVEAQNKKLIDSSHRLEDSSTSAVTEKNQDIDPEIATMPDISEVVEDEDHDEEFEERRKKLIAAKVDADKKKSSKQVHEEILRKAHENEEKRARENIHRTLADMQVPQKKHWWQRLFS